MRKVFADTGFFIVLANVTDGRYGYAEYCKQDLLERGYSFIFTDLVFAELARPRKHNLGWYRTFRMGDEMLNSPEFALEESAGYRGLAWDYFYKKYSDQGFSFCDCVTLAVMGKLGIEEVLTTDERFNYVGRGISAIMINE